MLMIILQILMKDNIRIEENMVNIARIFRKWNLI